MACNACNTGFRLIDREAFDNSVVEVYVCFHCGAERFRALSGRFCGVEVTQLGSMEAEGTAGGRSRREDG